MNTPPSMLCQNTSPLGDRRGQTELRDGQWLLDTAQAGILQGNADDAIWRLVAGLRSIRATSTPEEWAEFVAECLGHPLRSLLHQEPYTRRGYDRPQGYPGDAGLIDYLYLRGQASGEVATDLGVALHRVAVRTPAGFSVRFRRDLAAYSIDAVAARVANPEIMAIACGYLREAAHSAAIRNCQVGRFLAVDQDPDSIRVVSNDWAEHGISARCLSAAELIGEGQKLGRFHLVYALGLYDYLAIGPARMLTRHLFDLLAPGGSLLLANFVPGILEAGYMEAFMRWQLVYRTPDELREVCNLIPQNEVANLNVWLEDAGNIAYLTVTRS